MIDTHGWSAKQHKGERTAWGPKGVLGKKLDDSLEKEMERESI